MSCEANTTPVTVTQPQQAQGTDPTYKIVNTFTNTCTRAPYELIYTMQHPSNLTRVFDVDSREDHNEESSVLPVSNKGQGLPCNAAYVR